MNIAALPKLAIYLFVFLCIGSCIDKTVDSPYPPIEFVPVATIPGTGRASAVAFVINDTAYVALGRMETRGGMLKDCWQYDARLNTWTEKKEFPGTERVKAMAAVVNGKAYVGLGYDIKKGVYSDGVLKDMWMYDPWDNTWTRKADFPSLAAVGCVSFTLNNTIYIGAGFDDHGFTKEFWKYDPVTDKWTKLTDFSGPKRAGAVLCANNNRIFMGTGYRTISENDWWEYLPASDSWTQRKEMPDDGRVNGVSVTINERYFVSTGRHFGGNLTGGHVKSDIWEYDAVRNVWYHRGNIPNGKRENAIAFTLNGKGYIGFGENDNNVLNDMWCFQP